MTLPAMTPEGRLPPGIHRATLDEVHKRFVEDAPARAHRDMVFRAMEIHLSRLVGIAGHGRVWIDGGFVTHKSAAPNDVDLVFFCRDAAHLGEVLAHPLVPELLTLQGVLFEQPFTAFTRRIQPVAGLVDAFLASPRTEVYWRAQWSQVKEAPGLTKGFVEVML